MKKKRFRFFLTLVMTLVIAFSLAIPVGAAGSTFSDVPANAYYAAAVEWGADKTNGITSGTTQSTYSPDAPCTRAQIVTFLYRYAGSPTVLSSDTFRDVKTSNFAYSAINWANLKGITSGTGGNNFSPERTCTRAQIVTFLYREYGNGEKTADSGFDDAPGYAYDAINWAAANGITSGVSKEHFGSNQPCTRAQAITFIYRYHSLTNGANPKAEAGKVYSNTNNSESTNDPNLLTEGTYGGSMTRGNDKYPYAYISNVSLKDNMLDITGRPEKMTEDGFSSGTDRLSYGNYYVKFNENTQFVLNAGYDSDTNKSIYEYFTVSEYLDLINNAFQYNGLGLIMSISNGYLTEALITS